MFSEAVTAFKMSRLRHF